MMTYCHREQTPSPIDVSQDYIQHDLNISISTFAFDAIPSCAQLYTHVANQFCRIPKAEEGL